MGLHLTESGKRLARKAERTAAALEMQATGRLTPAESRTLIRLLRKIYRPD
jgi:DNA-binding MarR family transcriptional regulator